MSVLSLSQLSKSFSGEVLFQNVNLLVQDGEKIALVGDNGSGKSTLLKNIIGLEDYDSGNLSISKNTVVSYLSQQMTEFDDLDRPVLASDFVDEYEAKITELSNHLADPTIENYDALLVEYQHLLDDFERRGGYSYLSNLAQALNGLGLKGEILDRPIRTLSGGERMRVLLAEKLLENADLLLLDEPTNHLDIEGLEWLENFIKSYKGAVIVISHDRYFIDRFAERTIEISSNTLNSYKGNYSDFMHQKAEREKVQERTLESLETELAEQKIKARTLLDHRKMTSYHSREKVVQKLEDKISEVRVNLPEKRKSMSFSFLPTDEKRDDDRTIIKTEGLAFAWEDDLDPLFSNVNLDIRVTNKKVFVGPNGSGKSTLLSVLMGENENYDGKLMLAGDIKYAHLGQYVTFDDESLTPVEELQERTLMLEGEARNLLARYGFRGDDVFKPIAVLSGGEKSRLYLACVLFEEPDLLYLDEPTNHLDIYSREVLEDAINGFNGAVVAVSHDRYFIQKCNLNVLGFINNQIKEYASYESYRHFAKLAEQTSSSDVASKSVKPKKDIKGKAQLQELRKQKRELKNILNSLEQEISKLELDLEEIESNLSGADPEQYQNYAAVSNKLEELNEKYFDLALELEDIDVD